MRSLDFDIMSCYLAKNLFLSLFPLTCCCLLTIKIGIHIIWFIRINITHAHQVSVCFLVLLLHPCELFIELNQLIYARQHWCAQKHCRNNQKQTERVCCCCFEIEFGELLTQCLIKLLYISRIINKTRELPLLIFTKIMNAYSVDRQG